MKPVLIVIAGPNGAGKTTITKRLRSEQWSENVEYLNPDEIARDRFGDWNSPDAVRQAATYDNSIDDSEAQLCARTMDGHLRKIYVELPEWIEAGTNLLPKHEAFVDGRKGVAKG
jgi:uridine kinase